MSQRKLINTNTIFHEIYGTYVQVYTRIIQLIQNSEHIEMDTLRKTIEIEFSTEISELIFGKEKNEYTDVFNFCESIKNDKTNQQFQCIPLSNLQRRYLKTALEDSRFSLFFEEEEYTNLQKKLENEKPLFSLSDVIYTDQFNDGDDFSNPIYRLNFQIILASIEDKETIEINYGNGNKAIGVPGNLEYSLRDNKFRFFVGNANEICMTDVISVSRYDRIKNDSVFQNKKKKLVLELHDDGTKKDRNVLKRCLVHFSHFEKECDEIEPGHFRLTVEYEAKDEGEIGIRVLQFGPLIKVLEPQSVVDRIKDKIKQQMKLNLKG